MHREDGAFLEVEGAVGPILDKKDYSYLQDKDYIVQARFFFIDPKCPPLRGEANYWPYCLQAGIVNNQRRNEWIAKICDVYVKKGMQVLVITPFRIEHGMLLHDLIPNSRFMFGNRGDYERKKALDDFRNKEFMVLIGSTIYDEVINLPDVRCVVLAGGGKAHNKFFQRVGRGIRTAPGKEFVDIVIPWDSHGKVLLKHSKKLKSYIRTVDAWRSQVKMVGKPRPEYPG
jgi:superfamily II DNA or RNA helicase